MSDDLFADWKINKFIIVGRDLLDRPHELLVILTDIGFWATHERELDAWCEQNGAVSKGMTVTFPDEKTLTAFALRWR